MKTALRFLDTGSLRNCVNLEYLQGRD
jgi:hypothetical protein